MKALLMGTNWFPEQAGGLARVFYDSVQSLPAVGVEVKGLVNGAMDLCHTTNGVIHSFGAANQPLWRRWWQGRRLAQQVYREFRADVVASHFALYGFPLLGALGDVPLVTHFHGPWALESQAEGAGRVSVWLKKQLEMLVYRQSTEFIVLSAAFAKILQQNYGVPLERINIVPGGVNEADFAVTVAPAEARQQLGWEQDRFVVLTVRRLVQRMGLENLIMAMDQVRRVHPEILLLIAGKGAIQGQLQQRVQELGLEHWVQFLGFVPAHLLATAYRGANCSIVPTVALEGFGLTVIESLAVGTPVLGTPVGGIPEILAPLSQDLLLSGYTPAALAQGLIEAYRGERQLPTMTDCQEYVRQNYALQHQAKGIKAVYTKAIG
ncbi:MAG: glycosyltransferase family 4 protein [Pseudanabaena sp. ELA607]